MLHSSPSGLGLSGRPGDARSRGGIGPPCTTTAHGCAIPLAACGCAQATRSDSERAGNTCIGWRITSIRSHAYTCLGKQMRAWHGSCTHVSSTITESARLKQISAGNTTLRESEVNARRCWGSGDGAKSQKRSGAGSCMLFCRLKRGAVTTARPPKGATRDASLAISQCHSAARAPQT